MRLFLFILFSTFAIGFTTAQSVSFNHAYQQFPSVPKGFLEAYAYTHTRMVPIDAQETTPCSGMPLPYGIMGVFADGKGYFNENGKLIGKLSRIGINDQKDQVSVQIFAFAKACDSLLRFWETSQNTRKTEAEKIYGLMAVLTEFPQNNEGNLYAFQSSVYEVYSFLNDEYYAAMYQFPQYALDMKAQFGEKNYAVLSSQKLTLSDEGITNVDGVKYDAQIAQLKSADYGPALWTAAPTCNYSSRNGTAISAVTVHTVQGTYSGAISWGLNCNSQVSYHYVVRSSDGQTTQMVLETNKAWHVGTANPYTIGIEHEGYVSNATWYTNAMYQASANLVKDITQSGYGISPLRTYHGASSTTTQTLGNCLKIKGHQHYPSQLHTDPGINWNWEKYYRLINNTYTPTLITNASGSFFDTGGAGANYPNDERKVWVIQPVGASNITLTFTQFDVEPVFDKMIIYDGANINAPIIGSYSGSTLPATATSTTGALTIEFRSDCATNQTGWSATYVSSQNNIDNTPPSCVATVPQVWNTQDFTATLQSTDAQSGVLKSYYNVSDRSSMNAKFYSNPSYGFLRDEFTLNNLQWTNQTGAFQVNAGVFSLNDASQNNSNAYAQLTQNTGSIYLYTWRQRMTSSNANQRAGMHFFCSDPILPNRGNSYFVFFREETNKVQIYKVINDAFTVVFEDTAIMAPNVWYKVYTHYNPSNGWIKVYLDGVAIAQWQDANPLLTGNSVSLRSGGCTIDFDDIFVYKANSPTEIVSVGANKEIRYQSDQQIQSGDIRMIAIDSAGNWSAPSSQLVQVDWTAPQLNAINDGAGNDIDTVYTSTLNSNWNIVDPHSGISYFDVSVGTSAGSTNISNWVGVNNGNSYSHTLASPVYNTTYYINNRAFNNASLTATYSTDGQKLILNAGLQEDHSLNNVEIYPNPNDGSVLYFNNVTEPIQIEVYDANGKCVMSSKLQQNGGIPISLANGFYQVWVKKSNDCVVKKLIVH